MRRTALRGLIAALVIGVLVLAVTATAGAVAPQLWYLDGAFHPDVSEYGVMEKTWGAQGGWVTIPGESCEIWLAENAAFCDVTFPGGAWVVELKIDQFEIGPPDPGSMYDWEVYLGGWDTDTSTWYDIPTSTETYLTHDQGYNVIIIELQTGSATIYQGDYLALMVCNNDTDAHMVSTNGESSLRSPHLDPGYPMPEIATVALLGLGIVGLGGYMGLRRARSSE